METKIKNTKKDYEWSGLLKVPNEEIIKQLRVELGQANSYIEELKHELTDLKNKNRERNLQEKKEKEIKKERLEHLQNENNSLREKLELTRSKVCSRNKQIEMLQKQLLENFKNTNNI